MNRKLRFTLKEHTILRTGSIMELCDYLTDKILIPRFAASGMRWKHQSMNFFTFDNTCDPVEPTGTIFFNVPPLFAGCCASLESAIVKELGKLNIKTGKCIHEEDPLFPSATVIRIPIVDNPTVFLQPPEVSMSKTRGTVVLRDLLGYQPVNGCYEFTADDLLKRVSAVTEDKIAACTTSPVRDKKEPSGVRRMPSPVSMRAVHRCLEEIQLFAKWAVGNHYRSLAAI